MHKPHNIAPHATLTVLKWSYYEIPTSHEKTNHNYNIHCFSLTDQGPVDWQRHLCRSLERNPGRSCKLERTIYINGDIIVDNESLTINPGTTIIFMAELADLIITNTGQLIANGTSGGNIRFTSDDDNDGNLWGNR